MVTGAHAAKACGALDDALSALEEAGVAATVFPGIGENPLLSQCQAAAFAAEACRAEFLLGVGGRFGDGRHQGGGLAGGQQHHRRV